MKLLKLEHFFFDSIEILIQAWNSIEHFVTNFPDRVVLFIHFLLQKNMKNVEIFLSSPTTTYDLISPLKPCDILNQPVGLSAALHYSNNTPQT